LLIYDNAKHLTYFLKTSQKQLLLQELLLTVLNSTIYLTINPNYQGNFTSNLH